MKIKRLLRKIFILLGIPALFILLAFFFRFQLLAMVGSWLIHEDTVVKVDAGFVLSGNTQERAEEAARLYKLGYVPRIIPTGATIDDDLRIMGYTYTDATLGQEALYRLGVDSAAIETLPMGTSTFEEAQAILEYCTQHQYSRVMIISSKFHTRRVRKVFRQPFDAAGITVLVKGAEVDPEFIERWYDHENGLVFVVNEYLKWVYYKLKYGI